MEAFTALSLTFRIRCMNIPGEPEKKFPLLKIHSTKSNSQIWMVQILGCVWLVIPDLPNSEKVDFAETERQFPIKHKVLQSGRFQIYPGVDEVFS